MSAIHQAVETSVPIGVARVRARRLLRAFIIAFCTSTAAISASSGDQSDENFDPVTGYRTQRYQAAVPHAPPAGERVWLPEIDRLVNEERAILLDVSPITGAGYDRGSGQWRLAKPHSSLPGAVWLPEVGRGAPDALIRQFLVDQLRRLTGGDQQRPIIIFCHADCWMSWNAMKRIAGLGYARLYWFPEGTDGWRDFDRPLVPIEPVPLTPLPP